ncbi:tetratricopeptide repeat protein [Mucilaginibacter calamicampi]|uniref:histidine kinase n=1 Tax=Mucilaginibacter calamicampi TaxID=1302352 RepID=A0ABW2Z3B6_9SPHI
MCSALSAHPLNGVTDSLKKLISNKLRNNAGVDTTTIRRINTLAYEFYESHPDSTRYYGELEIKLARKINDIQGVADGSVQVASVSAFRGDYKTSERLYKNALDIYIQINHKHGLYNSYTGLGSIADYLGNYDKAIQLYNQALQISSKAGNEADEAECYNLIGITYDNKGDYSRALDNYFKSLIINIKQKDDLSAADKYCNIGVIMHELALNAKALDYYGKARDIWYKLDDKQGLSAIYQNIGEVLLDQGKYDAALRNFRYAEAGYTAVDDHDGLSLIYYDLGLFKLRTDQTDSALYYLHLSLKSANQSRIKYNVANAYLGLATIYNSRKNFSEAYKYAVNAQTTASTIGIKGVKVDAIKEVSTALAGLRRFKDAYEQMLLYSALRSRLKHNESIHKIASYNIEIEFAKKQKQIIDRQQKKEAAFKKKIALQKGVNVAYVAIIIVIATLAIIYYRGRRRQKAINALLQEKNNEILLHQEDIQNQSVKLNELNLLKDRLIGVLAHDLRAPISTLRGLFNLMIDKSITHTEFVEMTPTVFNKLEHTSDFLDTLLFWINSQVDTTDANIKAFKILEVVHKELTHLEDKIAQKDLDIKVTIDTDVTAFADPNSIRIVIHNFLTNAIKFSNRGGVIEISAFEKNNGMFFCIKDNGIGMSEEHLANLFKSRVSSLQGTENESGTGMGLLFCKDLIEKYGGKIWVESELDIGTKLCFDLPMHP